MSKATQRALEGTWTRRGEEWCVKVLTAAATHLESKANHMAGRECWVTSQSGKKSKVILSYCADYGWECGAVSFVCHVDQDATQKARDAYFAAKKAA